MSELDYWIEKLGQDGRLLMAFGEDPRQPVLLGSVLYWPDCAEVVILVDQNIVVTYTTPANTPVWWPPTVLRAERGDAREGTRDRVLREALVLGPFASRPRSAPVPAPPWAGVPPQLRDPELMHPIVPGVCAPLNRISEPQALLLPQPNGPRRT
jgi:hypothetical protein